MHVSYAEMARSAHEVLRMLGGSSYGVAAEAVEGLMLTHAALGKAYALTRLARAAQGGSWRPLLDDRDPSVLAVDLKGAPLILYAGLVADAFAVRGGTDAFRLIVTGTNGGWAAPYIVHRAVRHGVPAQAVWSPAPARSPDEAPKMHMRAIGANDGASILVNRAPDASSETAASFIISRASEPVAPDLEAHETIDFNASVRDAIARGFEVDEEEHRRDYTGISALIRVAFSERSRDQAG